jgi:hypothetical protein
MRSFDRGRVDPSPPPVDLGTLVPGAEGVTVAVDPVKVRGVVERCLGAAAGPPAVAGTEVRIPVAPASELARRAASLDAPHPDMVLYAILRRLLRHWGGDVTLAADGEATVAVVAFPAA